MHDETREQLFTLAEANALVPRLELILERMQRVSLIIREELSSITEELGRGRALPGCRCPSFCKESLAFTRCLNSFRRSVEEIEGAWLSV